MDFTLVRFSVHIDVKLPSIVSELDSFFLLLADIKGEGALALLAAPSYVHVYSPLQDRKQPFSYLGVGIFIVLVNCFSEPSSVKIFLSYERESKTFCSYHVEQKYIFLTGDSRIFDFMSGMGYTLGHNSLKRGIGFCLDYSSNIGA